MRIASALFCAVILGMGQSAFAAENPGDESGVGGLRLRGVRSAEDLRGDLQRAGFTPDALPRLRQLQELARDQFLIADGVSTTGGQIVEQWLQMAPAELWTRWNEFVRLDAERGWQQWQRSRDEAVLREYLLTYGVSRHGMIAWKTQARHDMDAGRWDHAAVALERVLNHRAATPADRAQAALERLVVAVRRQHFEEAHCLGQQHAALLARQNIRWEATTQPAAAVVAKILPNREAPASLLSPRPSLHAFWTSPLSVPKELQPYWSSWRQSYRDEGAWLNPVAEPVIVGNQVLVPTLTGLIATDATTAKVNWSVLHDDWQRIVPKLEKSDSFENRDWRSHLLEQLIRRESADSILARITTDGKRAFAVSSGVGTELDRLVPRSGANVGPREEGVPTPLENRLSAYDVQTGDLLWRIGGASAGPTYRFAQMYFCGPPCVVDGTLYIVGQRDSELQLVAIDAARGEGLWSTPLGDTPRSLSADPIRQRTACPVTWNDGLLIVTTANGAVIAVDAMTHVPRWAYRYPTTPRESVARPRGENTTFLPDPWWDAWRDTRVFPTATAIVFVSPESQRLHAIDRQSGAPLWTAPRNEALWLTGVTEQHAIVAGPFHLTAYHLTTGQLAWQTPIAESGGRPWLTATEVLQPLQNGHLARVSLTDGKLTLQRGVKGLVMGNVVSDGKSWFSVSADNISRWRDPKEVETLVRSMKESEPDSTVAKLLEAQSLLEAGDRRAARARLPVLPTPSEEGRQTAWQITLADLAAEPSSWRNAVALIPPGDFTDESFELAEGVIQAARTAGDLVEAGRLILRWLEQPTPNETVATGGVRRHVRIDLACLGLWDDIWQQADVSQRAVLSQLLEEAWQKAAQGADPFAVARLLEIWQPLAIAQQKAMERDHRHFLGRSLAAVELQLLALAEATPAPESSRLWRRLAREMAEAGFPDVATTYVTRARQADPTGKFDTGPALDLAAVKNVDWPMNSPQIDSQKERNNDVSQIAVPLDLDTSARFDQLDVSIDRLYRQVTFTSAEHRGSWTLRLPNSNGPMRLFPNALMGWGRGRILLLRVGAELFAITPFDERGEPVARILWMTDTLISPMVLAEQGRLEPLPMIPGIREEDQRAVNAFGRTLGQVGPVRSSYLCYQEKGKLVAVDTLTGRKRWERLEIPFDARCFGNEERVLMWSPSLQRVDVLRAIDGKLLERRPWTANPDRTFLLHDTWAYRLTPHPEGRQIVCEDVATGREIWSQLFANGSSPVVLDRDTLGVVDPAGRLHFLSLQSGASLGEPVSFPPMPQFERAIASRDADTWYVVLSDRVSRQAALQSPNQRNIHRTPPVDGPLFAIGRRTYQPRWRLPLSRLPWPLDHSRTAPLLVYSYKLGTPDQITNGVTNGILKILDKRTGAEVLQREGQSLLGYATLQPDPRRGLIEVRLEYETLRLRYLPHPPAPSPPEP